MMRYIILIFSVILVRGIKSAPPLDYQQVYRQENVIGDNNRSPPGRTMSFVTYGLRRVEFASPLNDFVKNTINKTSNLNQEFGNIGRNDHRKPFEDSRPDNWHQGDRNDFDPNKGIIPLNANFERDQYHHTVANGNQRRPEDSYDQRRPQYNPQTFNERRPEEDRYNGAYHSQGRPSVETIPNKGRLEVRPYNGGAFNYRPVESLSKDTAYNQSPYNQRRPEENQHNGATFNQHIPENNQQNEGNNQKRPVEIDHRDTTQNQKLAPEEFVNSDATYDQKRPDQSTSHEDDTYNHQRLDKTPQNGATYNQQRPEEAVNKNHRIQYDETRNEHQSNRQVGFRHGQDPDGRNTDHRGVEAKTNKYMPQDTSVTPMNSGDKLSEPTESVKRQENTSKKYERGQVWGEAEEDPTTTEKDLFDRASFTASECPPGEHKINGRCVSED